MRALALVRPGEVDFVEVPRPTPRAGEVVLRVVAAGLCQTDVHIRRPGDHRVALGTILGHEIAGTVVEAGTDVDGRMVGSQVAVYPIWSCGTCRACLVGRRNGCLGTGDRRTAPPTCGVTAPGGIAEFVRVPVTALAAIDGLDPAVAATMADAALTPYSSVRAVADGLGPDTVAVVIGIGGLGSMAVQILRACTAATVVAIDLDEAALAAVAGSAHHLVRSNTPGAADQVLAATGGSGAEVVFDFVGADSSLALAADVVAPFGAIRVTGMAGGRLTLRADARARLPRGATIAERLYGGTYPEFLDVLDLARAGTLRPVLTRLPFADAVRALDALEAGGIRGRAVLTL
ncbi:alcohol dehydrogenase catalytic domain-containing protein [Pseudonocardia sp. NPDC049154]|uniref:alcohol dehydrogenase catalytic domain-containing protein n=1 Tax=Pseudonocardia sp. NPDC049154 TaxID=3155501 RepID=UPI0033C16988